MKEPASYTEPHRINRRLFHRPFLSSHRYRNIRD